MRIFLLVLLGVFFACHRRDQEIEQLIPQKTYLDTVKNQAKIVEVAFWVNFLKSKIQLSMPRMDSLSLESVFNCIGSEITGDSCILTNRKNPDGTFNFYKDSMKVKDMDYFTQLEFVLDSTCPYFIRGFAGERKRYFRMTAYGYEKLLNFKLANTNLK